MLVSFCVIAYNEEKALDSLFKDIIAQDYPHGNIEVILVNAMSTDQTRRKMKHFQKRIMALEELLFWIMRRKFRQQDGM